MKTIKVLNITDDSFSPIGGQTLGQALSAALIEEQYVTLNFSGIDPFTSLFFNAMFSELPSSALNTVAQSVMITGLGEDDLLTYQRCLNNAVQKLA